MINKLTPLIQLMIDLKKLNIAQSRTIQITFYLNSDRVNTIHNPTQHAPQCKHYLKVPDAQKPGAHRDRRHFK